MHAYNFVDENKQQALYWRDVGTLEAYYEANMDVAAVAPTFNLYDKSWPMRTRRVPVSAGEVCVWRAGKNGHGDQLDRVRRVDRFGRGGAELACCRTMCA